MPQSDGHLLQQRLAKHAEPAAAPTPCSGSTRRMVSRPTRPKRRRRRAAGVGRTPLDVEGGRTLTPLKLNPKQRRHSVLLDARKKLIGHRASSLRPRRRRSCGSTSSGAPPLVASRCSRRSTRRPSTTSAEPALRASAPGTTPAREALPNRWIETRQPIYALQPLEDRRSGDAWSGSRKPLPSWTASLSARRTIGAAKAQHRLPMAVPSRTRGSPSRTATADGGVVVAPRRSSAARGHRRHVRDEDRGVCRQARCAGW